MKNLSFLSSALITSPNFSLAIIWCPSIKAFPAIRQNFNSGFSSITFAIFTNAKHHAFATYTIARNCKYRNNTLQSYWNNTFSAHKQKNQQRLKNDYISSITFSGNRFFTAFQKKQKPCVPITWYTFEITSWFHKYWHTRQHTICLYTNSTKTVINGIVSLFVQKEHFSSRWTTPKR